MFLSPVSAFESVYWWSCNGMNDKRLKATPMETLQFSTVSNNMADAPTCEVGAVIYILKLLRQFP
jgi:hypothetical protein